MKHRLGGLVMLLCLVAASVEAQGTREVTADARSIVRVTAKLRFTTTIVLPESEEILDFVCGDKDLWVVSGAGNLAYVKPAKAGAATNLNLVTAAGHIYAFLLTEGGADPDLMIYLTPEGGGGRATTRASSTQVEALQREVVAANNAAAAARDEATQAVTAARAQASQASAEADSRVAAFRTSYPTTLTFPYRFKAHERPFLVSAIFHDGHFTYIRTAARELPALYEVRDGVPMLVSFQVENGLYIIPKVLDAGYLVLGDRRLVFEQAH